MEGAGHNSSEQPEKYIEDLISSDLDFLLPLLRQYPKCYWIWNYRSWLLKESTRLLPVPTSQRLWEKDLGLASKMLSLDNRNFHGWGYRRMLIEALESRELTLGGEAGSMVEAEFKYTTKMIESNLSNFSAWHNRSKLIPRLLDEQRADDTARLKMLDQGQYSKAPKPFSVLQTSDAEEQNSNSSNERCTPTPQTSPSGSTTNPSCAPSTPHTPAAA